MKENKIKYLRARVTEKVKKQFETHCKRSGYNPSQRLRVIIEKEIRGEIK
jgi:antitoxin component of RelBE/YafQ-DinJ toxin-antitoxin module